MPRYLFYPLRRLYASQYLVRRLRTDPALPSGTRSHLCASLPHSPPFLQHKPLWELFGTSATTGSEGGASGQQTSAVAIGAASAPLSTDLPPEKPAVVASIAAAQELDSKSTVAGAQQQPAVLDAEPSHQPATLASEALQLPAGGSKAEATPLPSRGPLSSGGVVTPSDVTASMRDSTRKDNLSKAAERPEERASADLGPRRPRPSINNNRTAISFTPVPLSRV